MLMGITRRCREFSTRCVVECVTVVELCCSLNSSLRNGALRRKVSPVLKSLNMMLHRLLLFLTTHSYTAHTKVGLHRSHVLSITPVPNILAIFFFCVFFCFSEKEKESMHSSWCRAAASCGLVSIRVDCGLGGRRQNKTKTGLNS